MGLRPKPPAGRKCRAKGEARRGAKCAERSEGSRADRVAGERTSGNAAKWASAAARGRGSFAALGLGNSVARVSPDPLDRPRITRSASGGHSRAAPVGAHVPWTTWGRFAHNSPRARVEVHLPRVLESRSAGQRALAPPTDGHPPSFRNPQRQFSHYATAFQLRYGRNQPPLNHFPNHPTTAFQPRPNHRKPQPLHNRPSSARRTIPRLANNHEPTILRVEYKNDTISTKPSYFSFLSGRPHAAGILV